MGTAGTVRSVTDDELVAVLDEAVAAVRDALDALAEWGPAGTRPGQYHTDLVADAAAVAVLEAAGLGVVSEESGLHHPERGLQAVLDPVDGSTNAAHGLPWYATSLCVLDDHGARAAVVVNQATGECFRAVRGAGATLDGFAIRPSSCERLSRAVVGLSGWPRHHLGWAQMRAYGAAALDLCSVACGRLDAYVDCGGGHAPWDYLGGMLVCHEAGAVVADVAGGDLVTAGMADRRIVAGAATPVLLRELIAARRVLDEAAPGGTVPG